MAQFRIEEIPVPDPSKTQIAQYLANWMIEQGVCVPVYHDETHANRSFYSYSNELGVWKQIDLDYACKIAKNEIQQQWTRHTKQEFLNQIKHHEKAIYRSDMGLPENEILLNNGEVFNLDERTTRTVNRQDYALHAVDANNEEESNLQPFLDLVKETLPKEEHRLTLQEFVGWCLRFPNDEHEKALLILGETNSGKSTILKILSAFFKHSNLSRTSITQLGMERAFHVSSVRDSIINIDEDMSSATIEQGSTVKKLISQEKQFVEDKGEKGYQIKPQAKYLVASNVSPSPEEKDDKAFYQRFITLEAPETVPEEEQDKQLVEKLTRPEVLNGIFEWALEGMERLEEQRVFTHSPSILETRKKWDEYGSEVEKFIADCVEKKKDHHMPTADVYEMYEVWSMDRMSETLPMNEFIGKMKKNARIAHGRKRLDSGGRKSVFKHIDVDISN